MKHANEYHGPFRTHLLARGEASPTRSIFHCEEAQAEDLLGGMTQGVMAFDAEWRITYMNPGAERLTGQARASVVGRNCWKAFRTMLGTVFERQLRRAMDERVSLAFECLHEPSGRWLATEIHPLSDGGIAAVSRDITNRKHMERALREADRRKDEFLGMLAHELRNPLAAISGALQLLQTHGLSQPALVRACEAAERQAGHMSRLLDDLLDVTRVAQGKITLRKEPVALSSVIESAIEATRPQIEAMEHRLSVHFPPDLFLTGDHVRLTQVLANLLDNAVKYTPPRGEIHLRAELQGRHVVIRVRDNGSGITPELQPHVFDLFVQANASPNRAQGGLGIGLTMVRALVEMHGGCVEARSEGIGKGTEFIIHLPLRTQTPMAVEANEPRAAPTPRRILVVEDNADLAEVLSVALTLDGHQVMTALDGRQAIEIGLQWQPDVALVDIGMPEISGLDVARALRQEPALAHTLLIATTGYGREEDLRKTREAGFDHHLLKPVDHEALRRLLSR